MCSDNVCTVAPKNHWVAKTVLKSTEVRGGQSWSLALLHVVMHHISMVRQALTSSLRSCTDQHFHARNISCGLLAARTDHLQASRDSEASTFQVQKRSYRRYEGTYPSSAVCSVRPHEAGTPCGSRTTIYCVSMSRWDHSGHCIAPACSNHAI